MLLSKGICHRKGKVTFIFILRVIFEVPLHLPILGFFFFFFFFLGKAEVLSTMTLTNCFRTVGCSIPLMVGTKNMAT